MARTDQGFLLLLDLDRVLSASEQEALTGRLADLEPPAVAQAAVPTGAQAAGSPVAPAAGTPRRFVMARAGALRCGVDAAWVREVALGGSVTVLPGAPPPFLGLFNLRGAVLPVFDLAAALGQPPPAAGARTAFLVVDSPGGDGGLAALAVEEVLGMTEAALLEIEDVPAFACPAPGLIEGTALASGSPLLIVNLEALLAGSGRNAA